MTDVTVELDYDGRLTYTYPQPEQMPDGTVSWAVTAHPDGDLTDASGRHYPSLFWEGESSTAFAQDTGFVVKAGDATGFLEEFVMLFMKEVLSIIIVFRRNYCIKSLFISCNSYLSHYTKERYYQLLDIKKYVRNRVLKNIENNINNHEIIYYKDRYKYLFIYIFFMIIYSIS